MTLNKQLPVNPRMEAPQPDESWNDWFQKYGPKLLLCARQWTRNQTDAEDVVQEAFVRYWRNQRHLKGEPGALLITSIRRAAIDLARSNNRRSAREVFRPQMQSVSSSLRRRLIIESGPLRRDCIAYLRPNAKCSHSKYGANSPLTKLPANSISRTTRRPRAIATPWPRCVTK